MILNEKAQPGLAAVCGCLLVICLAGCAGPRQAPSKPAPFFPLGIYGVEETNDLALVKQAGFNLVTGPVTGEYLDAAERVGLKVLGTPRTTAGPFFDPARARQIVARFDRHPALWAWYLTDEPDLNWIDPEAVRQAHLFLKSLPARKPTALVLYQGASGLDYGRVADITMIDCYPVPWMPLANFGLQVRLMRLALGKERPLIAVIQAFDWSAYPENLRGEKALRPPTLEELRCMTYCALAEHANGLFYYVFSDAKWRLPEHPQTWAAVREVVGEVNARRPLFQAEYRWWPKEVEFAEPALRFNAALSASVQSVLLRARQGNAQVPAGDYILAVNTTPQFHVYSVTLPYDLDLYPPSEKPSPAGIPVLGEERSLPVQSGWISDVFEPYSVHIYGPLPAAPQAAKP